MLVKKSETYRAGPCFAIVVAWLCGSMVGWRAGPPDEVAPEGASPRCYLNEHIPSDHCRILDAKDGREPCCRHQNGDWSAPLQSQLLFESQERRIVLGAEGAPTACRCAGRRSSDAGGLVDAKASGPWGAGAYFLVWYDAAQQSSECAVETEVTGP